MLFFPEIFGIIILDVDLHWFIKTLVSRVSPSFTPLNCLPKLGGLALGSTGKNKILKALDYKKILIFQQLGDWLGYRLTDSEMKPSPV